MCSVGLDHGCSTVLNSECMVAENYFHEFSRVIFISNLSVITVSLNLRELNVAHLSTCLMMGYCDNWMSVVRRQQLLQRTSPL